MAKSVPPPPRFFDPKFADILFGLDDTGGTRSDRDAGIIWGSAVQDAIKAAILRKIVVNATHSNIVFDSESGLNSMYFLNHLAHAIGLIDQNILDDLEQIRKIRNRFAHWVFSRDSKHELQAVTFNAQEVKDRAALLHAPEMQLMADLSGFKQGQTLNSVFRKGETIDLESTPSLPPEKEPRHRFEFSCGIICVLLNLPWEEFPPNNVLPLRYIDWSKSAWLDGLKRQSEST